MAVLKTTSPCATVSGWAPSARPAKLRPSSSTRAAWSLRGSGSAAKDHRSFGPVNLFQADLDLLRLGRGDVLAHVVGADRQLTVAAVDEHRKLDRARPAELQEGVQRRARRAAVVEDVVDEHDRAPGHGRDLGLRLPSAVRPVVAMARHVEAADGDRYALELAQLGRQAA